MRKLIAALALLLAFTVPAMALTPNPTACVTPKVWLKNSTGSTDVGVVINPLQGAKITGIMLMVTPATGTWFGQVSLSDGGVTVSLGNFAVPTGAGNTGGVPPLNYLGQISAGMPTDSDGNSYFLMTPTSTLTFKQGQGCTGCTAAGLQIVVIGCTFE